MWLIDVATYELCLFDNPPPRYAILSHTWGNDEVTFSDMKNLEQAKQREGWQKIQFTCDEARKDDIPYAWVDTCCIDKSSSAELTEAINSMMQWYHQATDCYAYLSDLAYDKGQAVTREMLGSCRWFTRGWTLQELIAPSSVLFFSQDWRVVGTKESRQDDLVSITGIEKDVLQDMIHLDGVPVGTRMSWASKRDTTRVEDLAYCLLGIFDVSMPLVYGEGSKAFLRLQEEIVKQHQDLSLFAWTQATRGSEYRGIFAQSPFEFAECPALASRQKAFFSPPTQSITDSGVLVDIPANEYAEDRSFKLNLECVSSRENFPQRWLAIHLRKFGDVHVRAFPEELTHTIRVLGEGETRSIRIQKALKPWETNFLEVLQQRDLALMYRWELSAELKGERQTADIDLDRREKIDEVCRQNGIEPSQFAFMQSFNVHGGGDTIWWYCFEHISSRVRFAIICGMPLKSAGPSEHLLPWYALFSSESSVFEQRDIYYSVADHDRKTAPITIQRRVGDAMFAAYGDQRGNILQESLPTSFEFKRRSIPHFQIRLDKLAGGGSTFCVDVQYRTIR